MLDDIEPLEIKLREAGYEGDIDLDIVAGFNLFKALKKIGRGVKKAVRKVLPLAKTALPIASAVIPGIGIPTAMAASAALNIADQATRGKKPAKVAVRMMQRRARRGDPDARRWYHLVRQAAPMARARQIRKYAKLARRGIPAYRRVLFMLARKADRGDRRWRQAFELASGTSVASGAGVYSPAAGYDYDEELFDQSEGYEYEYPEDEIAGATMFEQLAPHAYYLPESETFGRRDAYYKGLRALDEVNP